MSPSHNVTRTYVAALCLVGLLALASHLALERVISANNGAAATINESGRQRMLSQRMAFEAALYVLSGDAPAREALARTADRVDSAHTRLSHDPALSPETRALYFSPPAAVDRSIREYLSLARTIADPALSPAEPAVRAAFTRMSALAEGPVVASLDTIVVQHQRESESRLALLRGIAVALLAVLLATLMAEALLVFRPMARRIARHAAELVSLARLDPLTGAPNLRGFRERGAVEVSRTRRYGGLFSVLVLDADFFKRINDVHGHAAGDEALRSLARTVGAMLRPSDVLGRIGGEEFAVLLPETPLDGAVELGRRICRVVADTPVRHEDTSFVLTVSIGAAALELGDAGLDALLRRADLALYQAKQAGRNQVCTLPSLAPSLAPPLGEPAPQPLPA